MSRCTTETLDNGGYCINCVEVIGVAGSPGRIDTVQVRAWDSGANLVARESVPCTLTWSPTDEDEGVFAGFYPDGFSRVVADPTTLAAAWYVFKIGISLLAMPYRSGAAIGAALGITSGSVLEIQHVGAEARFLIDGIPITTCSIFDGPSRVGSCLYASGDSIP